MVLFGLLFFVCWFKITMLWEKQNKTYVLFQNEFKLISSNIKLYKDNKVVLLLISWNEIISSIQPIYTQLNQSCYWVVCLNLQTGFASDQSFYFFLRNHSWSNLHENRQCYLIKHYAFLCYIKAKEKIKLEYWN